MSNEIRYKLSIDGARETQQVLQGLRKEAAETQKASDQARARSTASPSGANSAASAEASALNLRKRAVAQYETWRRGEEARTARERDAHMRAGVQQEQRAATSRLQTVREFGTRAIAIYQSVSARASALSGAFGGRSREAMLGENMNFQTSLIRFSRDTGINRAGAQRSVLAAARASGLDPSQILAGLGTGSDIAGDAGGAAMTRHASAIARASSALGTEVGTLATPLGQALNRGMSEDAIPRFLDRFVATATASRMDPEDLSGRLGGAIANMSTLTGASGEDAVLRTMQLQGVVGGAFSGAGRQAGAKVDQVMGMLSDEGFQRRLRRTAGITGTVDNEIGGQLADPLTTLQSMQASGGLVTSDQFERLGGSAENGRTLQTLIQGMRDPSNAAVRDAMGVTAEAGAEYTAGTMRDLQGVAGFGNQGEQMANFIENGQGFATYADAMADSIDTLNSRFPGAVEGVDNLTGALEKMISLLGLAGFGTSAVAGGAAVAGGGAAVAGGGGAVAAAGGVVAGGAAATAAMVALPLIGTAAVLGQKGYETHQREQAHAAMGGNVGQIVREQEAEAARASARAIGGSGMDWLPSGGGRAPATIAPFPQPEPAPTARQASHASGPMAQGFMLGGGGGGGSRPTPVVLDRSSSDALANALASRIVAANGRGGTERP
jgi:hypothetical protein